MTHIVCMIKGLWLHFSIFLRLCGRQLCVNLNCIRGVRVLQQVFVTLPSSSRITASLCTPAHTDFGAGSGAFGLTRRVWKKASYHWCYFFGVWTWWLAVAPTFLFVIIRRGGAPRTMSLRISYTVVHHRAVEHERQSTAFTTVSFETCRHRTRCLNTSPALETLSLADLS